MENNVGCIIAQKRKELGGRIITIGSDAHTAERVGENVAKAIEIVRKCGFKEVAVFQQRSTEWIKIV